MCIRDSPSGVRSLEGSVAIHKLTDLLVATGPESFVDMVESIVNARLANQRAMSPESRVALPATSGR